LADAFLQQSQRSESALLHRFEITSCSHARKGSSPPAERHYITQFSIRESPALVEIW
jgi:hypothetical protein